MRKPVGHDMDRTIYQVLSQEKRFDLGGEQLKCHFYESEMT